MSNKDWIEWVEKKFYNYEELGDCDSADQLFEEISSWLPILLFELKKSRNL